MQASATETAECVLLDGKWVESSSSGSFTAANPTTGETLPQSYPISSWEDCNVALDAAVEAFWQLKRFPSSAVADFLEAFATEIEAAKASLVEIAVQETGLPAAPRLGEVELPRTIGQLRQAAAVARTGAWTMPTIDTAAKIRSCYESLGPICVFGPNNFPFAFNSAAGGDFAAAIAAGNPVIAKANSSHPGTSKRFAELAAAAIQSTGLPAGLVQLIYRTSHADGERLVSDHRLGGSAYTGSRSAGLKLKAAADAAGKPIYLELSSVNPVVILPGAIQERANQIRDEYATSGLMGTGQMCTNPGLVLLVDSPAAQEFVRSIAEKYASAPAGTLLSRGVEKSLTDGIQTLVQAGAKLIVGGSKVTGNRCAVANTLLHATGGQFLADPELFQTEAFGNAALFVTCSNVGQLQLVVHCLEGNLTGCIYSDTKGSDDSAYDQIAPILTSKVGRMLNDKMPTGVAVSSAMNHGGPYPATGHPGFTAVGIPASLIRFGKLTSYDAVRPSRLPNLLKDKNPHENLFRMIDGRWTTDSL